MQDQTLYSQIKPQFPEQEHLKCPRCDSSNTKFCYYNNYNLSQPRHFCKNCRRYWTKGGALRNIPVGGGSRKNTKRSSSVSTAKRPSSSSSSTTSSVPAASSSAAAAAAATSSSPILPKPEPLVATTPGLGGTFDQDRRLLEVNGSFSSLLASSVTGGQYGNLLQGLNLNPNGPNLQLCGGFLDHGPSPTQDSGQTAPAPDHHHHHQNGSGSRRNGNSDLQMGLQNDSVSDGFLSLQGGEDSSSCWNGSNGWPDLAIYTPGSTFQ